MSESEDLESLKVTELQNELKKRGLDTKGRKADLITRLRQAINNGNEASETSNPNPDMSDEESAPPVSKDETSSPSSAIEDDDDDEEEENDDNDEQQPTNVIANELENPSIETENLPNEPENLMDQSEQPSNEQIEQTLNKKRSLTEDEEGEDNDVEKTTTDDTHENDESATQRRKKKSRWGSEQEGEEEDERVPTIESPEKQTSTKRASDDEDNLSTTSSSKHHRSSRYNDDRHSSSRRSERSTERELPLPEEETVESNPEDVVLDFYTSDLNLTVNRDCLSASNKSNDALCFLWAGTRATYGFKEGKICYEIRITEIIDCPQMPDNEKEKSGIRIGWSNTYSGLHALQLGEFNDSFAYTYSGKKMSKYNNEFLEDTYGESFGLSDIIGCYIDFGDDEQNKIEISFTKNGQDYGQAFEIDKTILNDKNRLIFYPHILVKNIKFECNFGQLENSWSEMKSDYTFAQNIPLTNRIRLSEPINDKNECQVLLLSGLTGSGKTTWANKYIERTSNQVF